jgi:predicted CxxxxCH...CXXCH cytochrome family protein
VPLGFDCVSPVESDYHPAGYASSSVHGLDFKLQGDDCRSCHGPKLEGCDFAGGCDNCHDGGHPTGWRSDCTYCHGGASNETGAPPSDLVRAKPPSELSFLAHDAHVVGTLHAPYACSQCHVQPADVLSEGHAFDATPGRVEVTFSAGLSPDAAYDGNGGCSNLYCHGDRRVNGSVEHSAAATECNSCHAFDDARKLSGRHDAHVNGGLLGFLFDKVACSECHSAVIDLEGEIIGPDLHVNGQVDLSVAAQGITYDGTRCNGTCHGAPHTFISTWEP